MIQDIAPHKYYVDYHPSTPNDTDLVFIYGHHTILCNFEDPQIRYPSIAEIAPVFPEIREKAKFLFRIDETNYYELRRPQLSEFDIWKYENTLILRRAVPGWLGFAGITGYQIHTWYTDLGFFNLKALKFGIFSDNLSDSCLIVNNKYPAHFCTPLLLKL